ncbi:hypothetical protein HDU96_003250 [Phlyctochytrium bullatum]|nr:hypothetical protein HDU96_003250 [Phlyctochytrium bullatum]
MGIGAFFIAASLVVAGVNGQARLEPPNGKLILGAWVDISDTDVGRDSFAQLNSRIKRNLGAVHLAQEIPQSISQTRRGYYNNISLVEETNTNASVILSVFPDDSAYRGITDADINLLAEQVGNITIAGHNVFLRFGPDMQLPVNVSSRINASLYVEQFRKVALAVRRTAGSKVATVWCPAGEFQFNSTLLLEYYPGDQYVDWLVNMLELQTRTFSNTTVLDFRTTRDPSSLSAFLSELEAYNDTFDWAAPKSLSALLPSTTSATGLAPTSTFATAPTTTFSVSQQRPSVAIIASATSGALVFVAVLVLGAVWITRRRRQQARFSRFEEHDTFPQPPSEKDPQSIGLQAMGPGTASVAAYSESLSHTQTSSTTVNSKNTLFNFAETPVIPSTFSKDPNDSELFATTGNPFEDPEENEKAVIEERRREAKLERERQWERAGNVQAAATPASGSMDTWTAEQVSVKLLMMGVGPPAVAALRDSNINGQALLLLTPTDLPRLGIEPASRAVVMQAIHFLKVLRDSGEGGSGMAVDTATGEAGALNTTTAVGAVLDDVATAPPPMYSEAS